MEPIKSFEDFINDHNNSSSISEEVEDNEGQDSIIPEEARKKLWEYVHDVVNAGVLYENDEDNNHTLESYMTESAMLMASLAAKSLKENSMLTTMAQKASEGSNDKEDKEAKKKIHEYVKSRLDGICSNMLSGFEKGVKEAIDNNAGLASMVASEMMKED